MSKTKQIRKDARSELKANAAQYPKNGFELIPQSQWQIAGRSSGLHLTSIHGASLPGIQQRDPVVSHQK
jgi:hypothetical protein